MFLFLKEGVSRGSKDGGGDDGDDEDEEGDDLGSLLDGDAE